jgi:hypothetical protein
MKSDHSRIRRASRLRRHSNLHSWSWPPPELTPEQREILERSKRNHPSALPRESSEEELEDEQ